jgi:hypothetical protein
VETSRVEAAIRRDCLVELEVDVSEIGEPGFVSKDYEMNGTPMSLTCYGANEWSCRCEYAVTPTSTPK